MCFDESIGTDMATRRDARPRLYRLLGWLLAVCCVSAGLAHTGTALGQATTESSADQEYERAIRSAVEAFEQQRYALARSSFERAHALEPSARTFRGLGIAATAQHRYDEALRELEAALTDARSPLTPEQHQEVTELVSWIRNGLGVVQLKLDPDAARARVDGYEVATTAHLDPGEHKLEVRADGYKLFSDTFTLAEAERLTLRVALVPVAPEPAPRLQLSAAEQPVESPRIYERWWFWTAIGVAVAGGVVATLVLTSDPGERPYEQSDFGVIRIR